VKKFNLGPDCSTLQAAVDSVMLMVGMGACEGSNIVPDDARSHPVNLVGRFLQGKQNTMMFARAGVMMSEGKAISLKIAVRSESSELNQMLCNAIR